MKTMDKVAIFVLVVVLGGGFLIYGVNRLRGIDLSQPPQFDLPEIVPNITPPLAEPTAVEPQQNTGSATDEAVITNIKEKLQALQNETGNKIFFKNSFKQITPEETEKFINDFLKDFPDLQKYSLNTEIVQGDYAAVLDLGKDVEKIKPTLDKLALEYKDSIEIRLSQQ